MTSDVVALCSDVLSGGRKPISVAETLEKMANEDPLVPGILLDALVVTEHSAAKDEEKLGRLKDLCRLCSGSILSEDLVKLSVECLQDKVLEGRYIKAKTRIFYKQLKFNLLREESEGYGKVITELMQPPSDTFDATVALGRLRCMIGQFNLDPNRVLDLILECFENCLDHFDLFLKLLRLYGATPDTLISILGFKFNVYEKLVDSTAPDRLFLMAALLIQHDMVPLLSLTMYLQPKMDEILTQHTTLNQLTAAAEKKLLSCPSTAIDEHLQSYASSSVEGDYSLLNNQKLRLLLALLRVGDWKNASDMIARLPQFIVTRHSETVVAFCALVNSGLHPFYVTTKVGSKYAACCEGNPEQDFEPYFTPLDPVTSWSDLKDRLLPMLAEIGPAMALDQVTFAKLIRTATSYFLDKSIDKVDSQYDAVVDLVTDILAPGLSMLRPSSNFALAEEVWRMIETLPYNLRYRIYGRWHYHHLKTHPLLMISSAEINARMKYIMKRLSKDTIKQSGRQIAKLMHSHPTVVLAHILTKIQQFENLIGPVVDSLKFLSSMSYDVLPFALIDELSNPEKNPIKSEGLSFSDWLQNLASFVGLACKKHGIELTGLLQYVANQLKDGRSFDLLVLREIIQSMSGIESAANSSLTQEQLEALAGGDLLRQEGGYLGQVRNTKRSIGRLKEALLQEHLVVGLCLLMAQQRGSIVYREGVDLPLKLTGQMLDQCQESLVQFGSFLSTNLKSDDYSKRIPSLSQLILEYNVLSDAAFFLCRPKIVHSVIAKYDELKKPDRNAKTLTTERKTVHYLEACNTVLDEIANSIIPMFEEAVWKNMTWVLRCAVVLLASVQYGTR